MNASSRITPAYAGKRHSGFFQTALHQDHPRVCGEKMKCLKLSHRIRGSPPRMRGKDKEEQKMQDTSWITPAYAGKRRRVCTGLLRPRDHPRVCGEKRLATFNDETGEGSPPRMRGKAPPSPARSCGRRDHPRVCGEKPVQKYPGGTTEGSPPRMRGKVVRLSQKPLPDGITPAYAGKRLKRSHSIGHFSCILCLFHSVLHRASVSGGSRAGPCAPPCLPAQNAVPV